MDEAVGAVYGGGDLGLVISGMKRPYAVESEIRTHVTSRETKNSSATLV